jgi:cell division septal protein FtsQ
MRAIQRMQQAEASPIPARSGRKQSRKGLPWRILSFFAIVVVVVLAVNFAFTNNAFRIEQVNVVGTHNASLISNIQRMGMHGQNIFLVNIEGLTAKVDAYPLVSSTVISKNWPNQLTVTVIERVPVLLWQTQHGTYSVDSQGVVIAPASETVGADHLMTVVDTRNGGKGQVLHPGTHLSQDDTVFAVDVFNHLPRVAGITTFKLRYDVTPEGSSYVVQSPDGWVAYLGGAQDSNPLDNRLIELQQIVSLAQQQQLTLATVDLRYGLHPVYTLKNV